MKNNFISSIWNFSDVGVAETNYATHDFLRWYGKLIPQLVSRLIKLYSKEEGLVLANFAGSGTVLLEANILKRNSIGLDSNPLSILLSKVKTHPHLPDAKLFLSQAKTILDDNRKKYKMNNDDKKWFEEDNFQDLMTMRSLIDSIKNKRDRDYFLLALASIIRKISKVDERCINHIVLDKNKIKSDVSSELKKKLYEMEESMREFIKIANGNKVEIELGDARNTKLPKSSIDLIISHPPYLGCINYSNIYKLQNRILGFQYDNVKQNDISTDSFPKYITEMKKVFDEMFRILEPKKYACVIIGDNRKNGVVQPTFTYFIQYATENLNFKLKDIFIWIMSQKAGMNIKRHGNHIDHNYILVFQKP